jgi:hypothetical protein
MNKLILILAFLFPKSISADEQTVNATVTIVEEEIEIIYIPPTDDEENPIFTIK